MQGSGLIDHAKEQHINDLERLVSEHKEHTCELETEVQELAKRPVLNHGSSLQALRDELANEKQAPKEARRCTSRFGHQHQPTHLTDQPVFPPIFTTQGEKEEAAEKDSDKIEELELRGEIGAG